MSKRVIHVKALSSLLERRDAKGDLIPFNAKVFKKDGGVSTYTNAVCTSSYHNGRRNLKMNNEIRKVRDIFFIEVNGMEVVL